MKQLMWKVRDNNGTEIFRTAKYDDTDDNRRAVGKFLRRQFPRRAGWSVARVRVAADGSEVAEDTRTPHTMIFAVDVTKAGIDGDALATMIKGVGNITDVRMVQTIDHDPYGETDHDLRVTVPAIADDDDTDGASLS